MKLLDAWRHLFTHRTRTRYVPLITTRQNGHSLTLMMVLRREISYEVYNSMHRSREPVPMDTFNQALRYMFPRSIEAAQTLENRRLRDMAMENLQEERKLARGKPPARDLDEDAKTAIIALGGVGSERASALAMEIHRGMERRRKDHGV